MNPLKDKFIKSLNTKTGISMPTGSSLAPRPSSTMAPSSKANTLTLNSAPNSGMIPAGLKATSNPSATSTIAPKITTPTTPSVSSSPREQFIKSFSSSIPQQINNPVQTPTVEKPKTAYDRYVESLNSKTNTSALAKKTADAERLANIQNRNDKQYLDTVSGRERILDESGGLKSGAEQSASVFGRRATAESAYGAIEESAAARSAGVSRDAYNDAISAGKSVYEAELAQEKANQGEGFTLGKDQVRYDAQGNIIAGGGGGSSSGAYVAGADPETDAYVKMVQSGSLKLENIPQEKRGSVAQGLASQPAADDPKKQYVKTQANEALTNIDIALGIINGETTGAVNPASTALGRALTGWIPGSDTKNLNSALTTIKSLIGFDALQKMRESSPTGGALGQVTERELSFLQSVQGSLDTLQGTPQFEATLNRVRQSFQTLQIINSPDGTPFELNGEQYIKQGNQMIPASDFNSAGNASVSKGNIPQRNKNPGNVKQGGLADSLAVGVDSQGHLIFPDEQTGFEAMKRDIEAKISGQSRYLPANPTLEQLGKVYAEDPNWPKSVAKILGVPTSTSTRMIPINSLIQAIAKQEGYYA